MLSTVMGILSIVYGIALCFIVIPYGLFFKFTKHPFLEGLVSSFFYGFFLAMLTVSLWYVAAIILMIVGITMAGKSENPNVKKVIIVVFIVLAVIIAVAGVQARKINKEEQKMREADIIRQAQAEGNGLVDLYSTEYTDGPEGNSREDSDEMLNSDIEEWDDGDIEEWDDSEVIEKTEFDNGYVDNMEDTFNDEAEYVLYNSDREYLDISEIEQLSDFELRIARNEIYARHGRLFRDSQLQSYFNDCSWYEGKIEPDEFDEDEYLNEFEKYNRDLILGCEK